MVNATPQDGKKPPVNTPPVTGGETKRLTLPSGATLSLTLSVTFMSLPKAERDAVSELMDKIEEYESPTAAASAASGKGVSE